MFNLNPTILRYDQASPDRINTRITAVHRLILFYPETTDNGLLGHCLSSMQGFGEILGLKGSQVEADDDAELAVYLRNLGKMTAVTPASARVTRLALPTTPLLP